MLTKISNKQKRKKQKKMAQKIQTKKKFHRQKMAPEFKQKWRENMRKNGAEIQIQKMLIKLFKQKNKNSGKIQIQNDGDYRPKIKFDK